MKNHVTRKNICSVVRKQVTGLGTSPSTDPMVPLIKTLVGTTTMITPRDLSLGIFWGE